MPPPFPIRVLIGVIWLAAAWLAGRYRIGRWIFSYAGGMLVTGFLFARIFDIMSPLLEAVGIVPRRSFVAGVVGFGIGALVGIAVAHWAVKTTWLYWLLHAILVICYAFNLP